MFAGLPNQSPQLTMVKRDNLSSTIMKKHAWGGGGGGRAVAQCLKESLTLPVFKVYSNVERPRVLKLTRLC